MTVSPIGESILIFDLLIEKKRNKEVSSVNILWRNQMVKGATWETDSDMTFCYPHIFPSTLNVALANNSFCFVPCFGAMCVLFVP